MENNKLFMLNGTKARLTIVAGGEKIYVYKEISKSVTVERKKKKKTRFPTDSIYY